MGAVVRGHQATRIHEALPEGLDVPIIRVLFECYEEGNGSLDGAWKCVPRALLEELFVFLQARQHQQEAAWTAFEDAGGKRFGIIDDIRLPDGSTMGPPHDELELIGEFLFHIEDELFHPMWDPTGTKHVGRGAPRNRVIDGAELHLN